MEHSWAITTFAALIIGTAAAQIAQQRSGGLSSLGVKIQIGTTLGIIAILIHNIFWEREINQMASKGWTLIYTFPAFLICFVISGILAILLVIKSGCVQRADSQADINAPQKKQNKSEQATPRNPSDLF